MDPRVRYRCLGTATTGFMPQCLPLIDMDPFVPGRLLHTFRAAASGGMQQVVDHHLLQECLCIEMAGPERGYLVTAVEAYTRNLLTAALLWLYIRESGDASVAAPELVLRAQGIQPDGIGPSGGSDPGLCGCDHPLAALEQRPQRQRSSVNPGRHLGQVDVSRQRARRIRYFLSLAFAYKC